jgi:hypothetical protein
MAQQTIEDIEDRLTKAVRMITNQPDQASHGVKVALRGASLHEADMYVVISNQDHKSTLFDLVTENRNLREEIRSLRTNSGQSWQHFLDLCGSRMRMVAGWKTTFAVEFGLTPGDLAAFERADRVPWSLLRRIEAMPLMPVASSKDDQRSRRTNFQRVAGELVDHLRAQGVSPSRIATMITELVQNYDDDITTLNQILGRRTVFSPDEVRPSDDLSPLTIKELRAMATSLFGENGSIRPLQHFVQTFAHTNINNFANKPEVLKQLDSRTCAGVRTAYHNELAMRAKDPKYERLSRAFGLLPKRTIRQRSTHDVSIVSSDEIMAFGQRIFGDDYRDRLAQLWGWDESYLYDIFNGRRPVPGEMGLIVRRMQECLAAVSLDDPEFVDKVHRAVKARLSG